MGTGGGVSLDLMHKHRYCIKRITESRLCIKETEDMKQDEFKDRLRIAMETAGLKQKDLAAMTGINPGSLSRYLQGTVIPHDDSIKPSTHRQ